MLKEAIRKGKNDKNILNLQAMVLQMPWKNQSRKISKSAYT